MRRCGCSLRPWPRCAPRTAAGTALASSGLSRREGGAGDEGGLERLPQPAREWASPGSGAPVHRKRDPGAPPLFKGTSSEGNLEPGRDPPRAPAVDADSRFRSMYAPTEANF
ncbi:hypothetical protein IscW_ISCW019015 [Ixodes scapularis]|uniref:Uncharacterized protein n=1 Tax=Ixodes scapularis TaxID=6945 RepID=B7PNC2_IXOSC|nr:hypothetical protein IscW_ISCW019015 [Ixodes scapularis]|eukprot:XP_002435285.1 hypothetical protein IscW_ISCW019015 [Ixodes scapularis]